jgi:hypothetical protein
MAQQGPGYRDDQQWSHKAFSEKSGRIAQGAASAAAAEPAEAMTLFFIATADKG